MILKELKKGDFFTLKNISNPKESQVYIKGDYDRSTKTYDCTAFDDYCRVKNIPGKKEVFTDFIF